MIQICFNNYCHFVAILKNNAAFLAASVVLWQIMLPGTGFALMTSEFMTLSLIKINGGQSHVS
jgi:hypothetical protein